MRAIPNEPPQKALQNIKDLVLTRMRFRAFAPSALANLFLAPSEDLLWWWSLSYVWSEYDFMQPGKPITEKALYSALVDLHIPRSKIVKRNGSTIVELKNIDFVYRTRRDELGEVSLGVSPHRKGFKQNECPHDFISPSGHVYELALHMLAVDKWIPRIKETVRQTFQEALLEQKVRDIKCRMAGAFLEEYFHGKIPEAVEEYRIIDSTPGEMDLIHLSLQDDGNSILDRPSIEIPLNFREILEQDAIREFTEDLGLAIGCAEMYK